MIKLVIIIGLLAIPGTVAAICGGGTYTSDEDE